MHEINVREARRELRSLLDRVEQGEEIILLRRGKPVARLVPPQPQARRLPPMGRFRGSLQRYDLGLSREVIAGRGEERY